MTNYEAAREKYAALGVDTDKAIETLKKVPVSLHCWQLDDVIGFDNDGGLTGGIHTWVSASIHIIFTLQPCGRYVLHILPLLV